MKLMPPVTLKSRRTIYWTPYGGIWPHTECLICCIVRNTRINNNNMRQTHLYLVCVLDIRVRLAVNSAMLFKWAFKSATLVFNNFFKIALWLKQVLYITQGHYSLNDELFLLVSLLLCSGSIKVTPHLTIIYISVLSAVIIHSSMWSPRCVLNSLPGLKLRAALPVTTTTQPPPPKSKIRKLWRLFPSDIHFSFPFFKHNIKSNP